MTIEITIGVPNPVSVMFVPSIPLQYNYGTRHGSQHNPHLHIQQSRHTYQVPKWNLCQAKITTAGKPHSIHLKKPKKYRANLVYRIKSQMQQRYFPRKSLLRQAGHEGVTRGSRGIGARKPNVAELLNITLTSLNRRIEKHGLEF